MDLSSLVSFKSGLEFESSRLLLLLFLNLLTINLNISSGQQTFVIKYKADVLFTKNKGAQNYFDYVLIGADWQVK
jgi:hypothetical protein